MIDDPEKLPKAKHAKKLPAPKRGYVHTIDAGQLARGVNLAGGSGNKFDPAVGVAELKKVGTQTKQGEPLMMIHYSGEKRLKEAMEYFKAAYRLAPKAQSCTTCNGTGCVVKFYPFGKKEFPNQ